MPEWSNQDLIVYHGTDNQQAGLVAPIAPGGGPVAAAFRPNLARCRRFTDFGRGFYTTTSLHQATQWANARVRKVLAPIGPPQFAVVLGFVIDRDLLAACEQLAFVRNTPDYWALVRTCRNGFLPHQRAVNRPYDVVIGPVSLWESELLIADCDQFSFHTNRAIALLTQPQFIGCGTKPGGLF
jgi:hypothetical protein